MNFELSTWKACFNLHWPSSGRPAPAGAPAGQSPHRWPAGGRSTGPRSSGWSPSALGLRDKKKKRKHKQKKKKMSKK